MIENRVIDVDFHQGHFFHVLTDHCSIPPKTTSTARTPLPLPGDLKHIWSDDLHIRNHVDPCCKELYSTHHLKTENPNFNTMACEQTFAWLSRHKKILCAMEKVHFHFYLHRMVKRRNSYICYCYSSGQRPVGPTVK